MYLTSNGDPSSRRLRAPSTAKPPPQPYPSSSKVRVEAMAPQGRSATVEGYKAERSGSVAGPSTPSSSPPSMFPSTSPPSRTRSRQPSGGTGAMASSFPSVPAHLPSWLHHRLFCTCKSIRTRYPWHDALHHLPLTFSNNEITTYRKKSVSLRVGSSPWLGNDTYATSNAHNAASYAFSGTKYIAGARTFTSP